MIKLNKTAKCKKYNKVKNNITYVMPIEQTTEQLPRLFR